MRSFFLAIPVLSISTPRLMRARSCRRLCLACRETSRCSRAFPRCLQHIMNRRDRHYHDRYTCTVYTDLSMAESWWWTIMVLVCSVSVKCSCTLSTSRGARLPSPSSSPRVGREGRRAFREIGREAGREAGKV